NYYHFLHLAAALRRRGWDALALSIEDPGSVNASFYHGEDVNLWHPDPDQQAERAERLAAEIKRRFAMVQFSGDGQMGLSPAEYDQDWRRAALPWRFIELKRAGVKIGYTCGGCTDGIAQSSFYRWSEQSCDKCTLRGRVDACSDRRNLAWGHKREMYCDLIAAEMLPALDYCAGPKVVREPLTMAIDAEIWRPDLDVPERHRIERKPGEILIFHGVGNFYHPEYSGSRDYKGTRFIKQAVERLQAQGHPVRLIFIHDLPSREVRFVQAQADIVVDQLNSGRYGANARECLMLGKAVVGFIKREEPAAIEPLATLAECPIVNADEATIEDVLRALVLDPQRRKRLGAASRAFALKWHSADALAARFEAIYDALLAGKPPASALAADAAPGAAVAVRA